MSNLICVAIVVTIVAVAFFIYAFIRLFVNI